MTFHSIRPNPPLSERHFTLATDLDGTFLGGSDADRKALYDWIGANRDTVGLVFVTGRDPGFITELVTSGTAPRPDYVVGDVGTTIAVVDDAAELHPIAPLEEDIAQRWNDMGETVRRTLQGHDGLTLQPTEFRYRVSYDLTPESFHPRSAEAIDDLGLNHLISDNRYFDVLPDGVSKGPSLRRLLAFLEIPEASVLAAGDTLNDLSMLTCGVPAVAVGGSERALIEALDGHSNVYRATAIGAAGILEAIAALDLHPAITESSNAV